jgi:Fe2+ or Zn2+ uptake regulation protein
MDFEAIKAHLAKKGLKATHQRLVVLQCLLMLKNHPSVEQVYEKTYVQVTPRYRWVQFIKLWKHL